MLVAVVRVALEELGVAVAHQSLLRSGETSSSTVAPRTAVSRPSRPRTWGGNRGRRSQQRGSARAGRTLCRSYEGCGNGATIVAAITRGCYDDNNEYVGQVASFEDRLWALQEGTDPTTGGGGTPGKVSDVAPACADDETEEQAADQTASESTAAPEQDAPEKIIVDCPEGLEDGTYILQPNGKYVFDQDTETFYFTFAEVEAMNESYGCAVIN